MFKRRRIIAVLSALCLLCGCWDSSEIQNDDIITAVTVDKKENMYHFSIEVAGIQKGGGSGGGKVEYGIISAKGETLVKARDAINRQSDFPLYLNAARVAIMTDRFAQKGIEEYVNRMRGDIDYRKSIYIACTKTEPEELLKIKPENSASVGNSIENTIKSLHTEGDGCELTIGEVLEMMAIHKVGFYMPEVNVVKGQLAVTAYSIFKDMKHIGVIPAEERSGLVILACEKSNILYEILYKGRRLVLKGKTGKPKVKAKEKDGKLSFDVNVGVKVTFDYMDELTRFSKKEQDEILRMLKNQIQTQLRKTLNSAQKEFRCDFLKFFRYYRAIEPKKFESMTNWNERFSEADITLNVKTTWESTNMLEIQKEGKGKNG